MKRAINGEKRQKMAFLQKFLSKFYSENIQKVQEGKFPCV